MLELRPGDCLTNEHFTLLQLFLLWGARVRSEGKSSPGQKQKKSFSSVVYRKNKIKNNGMKRYENNLVFIKSLGYVSVSLS